MDLLVIGVSNVVTNRLLPAIAGLASLGKVHLASRRADLAPSPVLPEAQRGTTVHGYERALQSVDPCLAWISLPNHLHAEWAGKALAAGFHVIVDKPAFLCPSDTERLLRDAEARRRCLAEATVWSCHPQVAAATAEFARRGTRPLSVQTAFSFPGPAPDNFRNDLARGGGCLNDLGPYAASAGRIFFGKEPLDVRCRCLSRDPSTGVDTAFAVTAVYPDGGVLQGFHSFRTEYRNAVTALGAGLSVTLDPAFSTQLNAPQQVRIRSRNQTEDRVVPEGNSFGAFLARVIDSISRRDWTVWTDALRTDARFLDRAAHDAGVERYAD